MTRVPRRPSDGKPLPNACAEPIPEWIDEPTVPDHPVEDLDQELAQHAEAGQGEDDGWSFWPRKAVL